MYRPFRFLRRTALAASMFSLGGILYYAPPEIRTNPRQIGEAFARLTRITVGAAKIGYIYQFTKQSKSERHTGAAEVIRDVCIANAGVYIK